MPSVSTLGCWEGLILLCGFYGIVFFKLVTGSLDLSDLLNGDIRDRTSPSGYSSYASAGRAQSLVITVFTAVFLLLQIFNNPEAFPGLSERLVGIVAGSQVLYLSGKAQAMLFGR